MERIGSLIDRPDLLRIGELDNRPGEPPLLVADVSRLANEVKWSPFYNLDVGLEDTIRWWRDQTSKVDMV